MLGAQAVPFDRLIPVFGHTLAVTVEVPKIVHRSFMALLRRLPIPLGGFRIALLNAEAPLVGRAEHRLGSGMVLVRSFAEPRHGFRLTPSFDSVQAGTIL